MEEGTNAAPGRGPIAAYRRCWLPELVVLGIVAVAGIVLFVTPGLDLAAARWFYHPHRADVWPVAKSPVWSMFYRSAPWLTAGLGLTGGAMLVIGLIRHGGRRLRMHGLFVLLSVAIGPGIVINGILKDHWGRPRPRQIVAFGGDLRYTAPLQPSAEHGKSFPCGHCSVGYLYAIGWWLWRRSRPRRAAASLAFGVTLGSVLGVERMAAGGHFLSDALWSALIAYGIAHALYYYVLRIPAREDARTAIYPLIERHRGARAAAVGGTVLLVLGILGGGILASPQYRNLDATIRLADYPTRPEVVEVIADTLDVDLRLVQGTKGEGITCSGYLSGFGLPTDEIDASWSFRRLPQPTLRFRATQKGWFTDIDGMIHITIPVNGLNKIVVRTGQGNIDVRDLRPAGADRRMPLLELGTSRGRVSRN